MDLFRNDFDTLFTGPMFAPTNSPITNIIENEKEVKIELSVPGFKKNELEVTVENKILMIRGTKQVSKENSTERYLVRGFSQDSFVRSYRIDSSLIEDSINSKLEDGILSVSIPKTKKVENKKLIDIT